MQRTDDQPQQRSGPAVVEQDADVAGRLSRIDNRHMDYMRGLFGGLGVDDGDVEARSLMAFSLFIANQYIVADHGSRSRTDVIALAVQNLVGQG